jgi:hypothetical protein
MFHYYELTLTQVLSFINLLSTQAKFDEILVYIQKGSSAGAVPVTFSPLKRDHFRSLFEGRFFVCA